MNYESAIKFGQSEIRPMSTAEFARIRQLAFDICGIDFADSKKDMVASRLDRIIRRLNFSSYENYYQHVRDDKSGAALREFIDALATNHTNFLRESDHFTSCAINSGGLQLTADPSVSGARPVPQEKSLTRFP